MWRSSAVASRTAGGKPVCINCFNADVANHGRCDSCGGNGLVFHREGNSRAGSVPQVLAGADRACQVFCVSRGHFVS
jgi:hypothetical protein